MPLSGVLAVARRLYLFFVSAMGLVMVDFIPVLFQAILNPRRDGRPKLFRVFRNAPQLREDVPKQHNGRHNGRKRNPYINARALNDNTERDVTKRRNQDGENLPKFVPKALPRNVA